MNFTNTVISNTPHNLIQPRRGQIYVGFQCHQRCGFCYYKSRCDESMFSLEDIKRQIDFEYEYGIRDFEITGGEPSEHKQLRDICEYIKQNDPQSKIAVITNGGLFNSPVWDLIDELLVSYHLDKNPKEYDKRMFPLGSTYSKVAKCVETARAHGILIRTNTVIGRFNMNNLPDIVSDLIEFKPSIINFLPVNLFDESSGMVSEIDYVSLRPILKRQFDRIEKALPDTLAFVRYMPFCDMKGYESHIVGHLQHIYDWFDWNRELDGIRVLELVDKNPQETLGRYGSTSVKTCFDQREYLYEKGPKCLFCKYNIICDGVERSAGRLVDQTVPSNGLMIRNPMAFIGDATHKLYRKVYGR